MSLGVNKITPETPQIETIENQLSLRIFSRVDARRRG